MSRRGTYFASKDEKHSDMVTLVTAKQKQNGFSQEIMVDKRRKNSKFKYIFRPHTNKEVIPENKTLNTLVFLPDPPTFGVICQGFKWQLTCKVGNAGLVPERMTVSCVEKSGGNLVNNMIKCSYEPVKLAAGMKTDVMLTIDAEATGISECDLRLFEVSTKTEIVKTIRATVVEPKIYKALRAKLISQGKNILCPGVQGICQELSSKEFFYDSKMTDEERDEVLGMPYVNGVYYNPWEKQLCTDEKLMKVVVEAGKTTQESIDTTEEMRNFRLQELESRGFYTTHAVALSKAEEKTHKEEIAHEPEVMQPIVEEDSFSLKTEDRSSAPQNRLTGAYMKKFIETSETTASMKTTVRR